MDPSFDKEQFLTATSQLPYQARCKEAAVLGAKHGKDPRFLPFAKSLIDVPVAVFDEVLQGEEERVPTLKGQQKLTGRHLHSYQMGIVALGHSGVGLEVLKDQLAAPTIFMKRFIANHVCSLERSDDALVQLIASSVSATRRHLLHATLVEKRTAVIDALFPIFKKEYGIDVAASILHGCSRAVILANLGRKDYFTSKHIHHKHIAHHHPDVIVALMRQEFIEEKNIASGRKKIWTKYTCFLKEALQDFMDQKETAASLVRLLTDFPVHDQREHQPKPNELLYYQALPESLHSFWKQLANANPEQFWAYLHKCFYYEPVGWPAGGHIVGNFVSSLVQSGLEMKTLLALATQIFAFSTPFTIRSDYSIDKRILVLRQKYAPTQQLQFCRLNFEIIKRHKTKETAAVDQVYSYHQLLTNFVGANIDAAVDKLNEIVNTFIEDKKPVKINLKPFEELANYIYSELLPYFAVYNKLRVLDDSFSTLDSERARLAAQYPTIAKSFWTEYLLPRLPSHQPNDKTTWGEKYLSQIVEFANKLLAMITTEKEKSPISDEGRAVAQQVYDEIVKYYIDFAAESLLQRRHLLYSFVNAKQPHHAHAMFKLFAVKDMVHTLNENDPSGLLTQLFTILPIGTVVETVKTLVAEPGLKKGGKDVLNRFLDVADVKLRQQLQKACDSNNITERLEAIKALVGATQKAKSAKEVHKTLKFLRAKLKNEIATQRSSALSHIVNLDKENYMAGFLLAADVGQETLDIWLEMLQDALESPDIDSGETTSTDFNSHPVLRPFSILAKAALVRGSLNPELKHFFEFGVQLQWQVVLYRLGRQKAAKEYLIDFGQNNKVKKLTEHFAKAETKDLLAFVDRVVNAYQTRIAEMHPGWKFEMSYLRKLFEIAGHKWAEVPALAAIPLNTLEHYKTHSAQDHDGLYTDDVSQAEEEAEVEHEEIWELFGLLRRLHGNKWKTIGILRKISDEYLMKSRHLPKLVFGWMADRLKEAQNPAQRLAVRDQCVQDLLALTPSAIHVKFVRDHLFKYRQDLLDKYLQPGSFRGIFCVQKPKSTAVTTRSLERRATARPARGRGGRASARVPKRTPRLPKRLRKTLPANPLKYNHAKAEEEDEEEQTMLEEVEASGVNDHQDFFMIRYVYGLHRLLPRQVEALAARWQTQVLNSDRPITQRVDAAIRWTLMPTVSYQDVLRLIKGNPTLPTNVVDVLYKGMVNNDEPTAPLNYLFSPAFLETERAAYSVYTAAHCIPHLIPGQITTSIEAAFLSSKRTQMKITTFKQVMRLLLSQPTEANVKLIFREWTKRDLHRDVRIVILRESFRLLHRNGGQYAPIAWKIFEMAARPQSPTEVLLALLGISGAKGGSKSSDLFQRPRLAQFLASFSQISLSAHSDRQQWANLVVFPLAKAAIISERPKPAAGATGAAEAEPKAEWAVEDDVKHLAISVLASWSKASSLCAEAAKILAKAEAEYWAKFVAPGNNDFEAKLNYARWVSTVRQLADVCGVTAKIKEAASKELFIAILHRVSAALTDKAQTKQHDLRSALQNAINRLFQLLPGSWRGIYTAEDEQALVAPFKRIPNLFVTRLALRVVTHVTSWEVELATQSDTLAPVAHEMLSYYNSNPTAAVKASVIDVLSRMPYTIPLSRKFVQSKLGPLPTPSRHYLKLQRQVTNNWISSVFSYIDKDQIEFMTAHYKQCFLDGSLSINQFHTYITSACSQLPVYRATGFPQVQEELLAWIIGEYLENKDDKAPAVQAGRQWVHNVSYLHYTLKFAGGRLGQIIHRLLSEEGGYNVVTQFESTWNATYPGLQNAIVERMLNATLPTSDPLPHLPNAHSSVAQRVLGAVASVLFPTAPAQFTALNKLNYLQTALSLLPADETAYPLLGGITKAVLTHYISESQDILGIYETPLAAYLKLICDKPNLQPYEIDVTRIVEFLGKLLRGEFWTVSSPLAVDADEAEFKYASLQFGLTLVKHFGAHYIAHEKGGKNPKWRSEFIGLLDYILEQPDSEIKSQASLVQTANYSWTHLRA